MNMFDVKLSQEQLDRIIEALDYQFGLTENSEQDDKNQAVIKELQRQIDNASH